MTELKRYNALKQVTAKPMNRQEYNDLRGWDLPADENGSDEGYLTVDINGEPNLAGYDGYVSWTPKAMFDKQFVHYFLKPEVCIAPKDDRELTDDEIKTLASGGSLCDCHEFVEGFSDLDGNERFGIDMAMAIIEDGTMSVQCEADGVMALLTPKHVDSEDWRIVDTPTPSHVTRLNVEAHQVLDRLDKLNSFLAKPRPNFISEDDWALLQQQQGYMKSYSDVLIQRINKLG